MISYIENFWMDYSASYYRKLKKVDKAPGIDIYFNTSTTMSLNAMVPLIILSHVLNVDFVKMQYMLIPMLIVFLFNWLWVKRNPQKTKVICDRKPKYRWFYYRLYSLSSVVIFLVTIYLTALL